MKNPTSADINEFVAAILFGDLPLSPASASASPDRFLRFRELIDQHQDRNRPRFPGSFGELLLRIDPELISSLLEEKWTITNDGYIADLIRPGSERGIDVDSEPLLGHKIMTEEEAVSSRMKYDHSQNLSIAAARGDQEEIKAAFEKDVIDFFDLLPTMLRCAIEAGQLVSVICLFDLARYRKRSIGIDYTLYLEHALKLAAMHRQEPIISWLLSEKSVDPARFDAAFWRNCFSNGPSDIALRDTLIEHIPGYGNALLLKATSAEDWQLAREITARLNHNEHSAQAYERSQARKFLERISMAVKKPRSEESVKSIVSVWLHLASGCLAKEIASYLDVTFQQISNYKKDLEAAHQAVYGNSPRFNQYEARRIWEALQDHAIFEEHRDLWNRLTKHSTALL